MHPPLVAFVDTERGEILADFSPIIDLRIGIMWTIRVLMDKILYLHVIPQSASAGVLKMIAIDSAWLHP